MRTRRPRVVAARARSLAALLALVALTACATPSGARVFECDPNFELRNPHIVQPSDGEEQAVPIECMRQVERRRIRIGFTMPPGPDCYVLSRVEVVESEDAASVTLFVARSDDPTAGSCPPEPRRAGTEIDLQAPVGRRTLLDGSR
jgi:hypothetical protein